MFDLEDDCGFWTFLQKKKQPKTPHRLSSSSHLNVRLQPLEVKAPLAVYATSRVEITVSSHNLFRRNASLGFQGVYVLRVAASQHALVMQQADEGMGQRWFEVIRIELMSEGIECFRVLSEEAEFEYLQ